MHTAIQLVIIVYCLWLDRVQDYTDTSSYGGEERGGVERGADTHVLYVCVYIYIYTSISISLPLSLYIYIHTCIYVYVCVYLSLSIYIYICIMYVYIGACNIT